MYLLYLNYQLYMSLLKKEEETKSSHSINLLEEKKQAVQAYLADFFIRHQDDF